MVFGRGSKQSGEETVSGHAAKASDLPQLAGFSHTATLQGSNVAVVNAEVQLNARADVLFGLLADPNKHPSIFEAIEGASCRLLEEEGPWRKYELDYQARWKFWRVSGVCENRLFMETDANKGTVSFRLREPGFLRVYEGTWVISPAGLPALNLYARQQQQQPQQPGMQPSMQVRPQPQQLALAKAPQVEMPERKLSLNSVNSAELDAEMGFAFPPWAGLFRAMSSMFTSSSQLPGMLAPAAAGRAGTLASMTSPLLTVQNLNTMSIPPSTSSQPSSRRSSHDMTATLSTPFAPTSVTPASTPEHAPMPAMAVVRIQDLRMGPKVAPPYPLGGLLKNHAVNQVEDMIKGLLAAAQQLQADMPPHTAFRLPAPATGLTKVDSNNTLSSAAGDEAIREVSFTSGRRTTVSGDSNDDSCSHSSSIYNRSANVSGNVGTKGRALKNMTSHRILIDEDEL